MSSGDFTIPSRNMTSMNGRNDNFDGFRLSSMLSLDQAILMEPAHLNPLDMPQNNSESDVPGIHKYDFDSATKSESGAFEEDQDLRPRTKKRCHRHTQHQIQEMEAFFKECPHPDDKQRKELSREIGLKPLQIKFWFQNKRTQLKAQHDRDENTQLKTENEKLRADNIRFKEALKNASCLGCGGQTAIGEMSLDEQQMRLKNAHLREEIDRISAIAAKLVEKPVVNYPLHSPPSAPRSPQLRIGGGSGGHPGGVGEDKNSGVGGDKPIIIELAIAAMKELIEMAQMGEPLWFTTIDGTAIVLNEEEYNKCFPQLIGPKPIGFHCEASQESAIVFMNHVNLIEVLMDVNQWSTMFSGIVSSAMTLEVLSTGVPGSYNDALQVMTAEFQVPSPYMPNRESNFVRYCKQHNERTWAIVDVSLDKLRPNPPMRFRKKPSGCIIEELPNGCSKVIWIEHVEVDHRGVHNLFKQLVSSGHAFGAKRWLATLDRQCERHASAMATNIPTVDVGVINLDGRKNILELAERMVISFFDEVSACSTHSWETLSGTTDVRIVTRKNIEDPGNPIGLILSAAATFWLPHSPKRVFEFLCDKNFRSEWDLLSKGGVVQEMAHIANGRNIENYVSILHVNDANPAKHSNISILQETRSDSMGSFLIYAPIDLTTMNSVLDGSVVDPDYVAILPSGFAILPDGITAHGGGIGDTTLGGSLLTMAYQILVDPVPTTNPSLGFVAHVNKLIDFTAERIKGALSREVAGPNGTCV